MIEKFSPQTKKRLEYYVYVYSDPDTKEPFYVGKGKGDRVFSHLNLKESDGEEAENEKIRKIRDITEIRKKQPIIEILAHGLNEETALKVEAAAIDLIGIKNLTNLQRGHESSTYGKIEVSTLEARYSPVELEEDDIIDNVMIIKINRQYRNNMSSFELYEATRGYWRVNYEKAKDVKYVLSVYDGMVLEVYKVCKWLPAQSTFMDRKVYLPPEKLKERYEFIGKIAEDDVRNRYVNKSVKSLFKYGEANPFKYYLKKKE